MKLHHYALAACVLLLPTLAHAQDFGVMESAETIDRGNFKLKVNPMFILGDGDTRTGIVGGVGYGFTDRLDVEANLAKYTTLMAVRDIPVQDVVSSRAVADMLLEDKTAIDTHPAIFESLTAAGLSECDNPIASQ